MLRTLTTLVVASGLSTLGCATADSPQPTALGHDLRALDLGAGPPSTSDDWNPEIAQATQAPTARRIERDNDFFNVHLDKRYFTLLLGSRWMDDSDWDPVDDQLAVGLQIDSYDSRTGHGYEVGTSYSEDSGHVGAGPFGSFGVDGRMLDVYGGYRHTFGLHDDDLRDRNPEDLEGVYDGVGVHPYLAGGLLVLRAERDADGPGGSHEETSPGAYVRAGIGFDLEEAVRLGIDYRHAFLTDDIGAVDDADFGQFMLSMGFRF